MKQCPFVLCKSVVRRAMQAVRCSTSFHPDKSSEPGEKLWFALAETRKRNWGLNITVEQIVEIESRIAEDKSITMLQKSVRKE